MGVLLASWSACDCAPARSKPWRHAPEPVVESDVTDRSELLAREAERIEARDRRSQTLRVAMSSRPEHLNPMTAPSVWTQRIAQDTVFETLIRYRPPEDGAGTGPGRYASGLARSWDVSPSGREVRIELEPDVRFHDGRRMTSVDVQFSIDSVRDPRVPASHLRSHLDGVTSVELISPTALRIRLARPNGYVLRALAQIPILPEHVYEGRLRRADRGEVVGTGPYRVHERDAHRVRLRRWDEYWGRAPAIRDLEFVHVTDAAKAIIAAKRGDFDVVPALIPEHYPDQASAPGIEAKFAPLRLRPPHVRYLALDASEPPFDDPQVRRAVAHMVDRSAIAEDVHDGLATPVAGPVWPGGPGDGAAAAPPSFDPARSARLLDAAGWVDQDGDGTRERDGTRLRVSILASDDDHPVRGRVVASLRKLGFQIYERVGNAAVLENRLRVHDFDLALVEWRGAVDRDLTPLVGTGGALNYGRFSDRGVDRILASLRGAWEPAARASLMADLARQLASDWPLVAITAPHPYGLLHRRVRGAVVWNGWIRLRDLSLEPDTGGQ